MNKESLEIAKDKIYQIVDDERIPIIDKVELLINIINFLSPEEYEENIKVLRKHKNELEKRYEKKDN